MQWFGSPRRFSASLLALTGILLFTTHGGWSMEPLPDPTMQTEETATNTAVLAGGCFWCVESALAQLEGVSDVVSGYAGGKAETATYSAVSNGQTKHAEVVKVTFDPTVISYGQLLKVFMSIHDPTQLNRQGADVGRHYRSAIFPLNEQQEKIARSYVDQLNSSGAFRKKVVTTIEPDQTFYLAEEYHQDYAENNPNNPYIRAVSEPKRAKATKLYPDMIKK